MVLVSTVLAIGAAAPAQAITGGVPDGDRHPNVGALGWDLDGTGPTPPVLICTGSVISDRAFLTARHCIEPPLVPLPADVQWAVTLEPGTPAAPILPGGTFPAQYPACCGFALAESSLARPIGIALHPEYRPGFVPGTGNPTAGANDLAVLRFAPRTFAGVTPVRVVRRGELRQRTAARRRGPRFTLAGYGTEKRETGFFAAGYRKTARAPFHALMGDWLLTGNAAGARPRRGALCYGDSGSPLFLGRSRTQVALFHDSTPACSGVAYSQRLDTPAAQAFLAPFLPPGPRRGERSR